jgi:Caspase domain
MPFGTLDLLISPTNGPASFKDDNDQLIAVEPAIMTNASTAINRRANQPNSDAQNLAIFYFCGHGLSVGLNNGLLVEDFGDDHIDLTILKNMINVDNLNLATDLIRARKQCFFIDACRNSPTLMAQRAGQGRTVQFSSTEQRGRLPCGLHQVDRSAGTSAGRHNRADPRVWRSRWDDCDRAA